MYHTSVDADKSSVEDTRHVFGIARNRNAFYWSWVIGCSCNGGHSNVTQQRYKKHPSVLNRSLSSSQFRRMF